MDGSTIRFAATMPANPHIEPITYEVEKQLPFSSSAGRELRLLYFLYSIHIVYQLSFRLIKIIFFLSPYLNHSSSSYFHCVNEC